MRWQIDPVALGAEYATRAHNLWLRSQSFDSLRAGTRVNGTVGSTFTNVRTLYRYRQREQLIATDAQTDFMLSPVVDDSDNRLYFLFNGLLQFYRDTDVPTGHPTNLILGKAVGVVAPATNVDGGNATYGLTAVNDPSAHIPDSPRNYETNFVYTYVNRFGEEGPPSLPSNSIQVSPGEAVRLVGMGRELLNPDTVGLRIYVLIEGEYLRTGFPSATVEDIPNLTVTNASVPVSLLVSASRNSARDVLISLDWDPPPAGLTQFIALDHGMAVATDGHTLYFNEPYFMHAWPLRYRRKVEDDIKRLAKIRGGFVAITDRGARLFVGTHPQNIVEVPFQFNHPIGDPYSSTEYETGVIYATHEGLAFVSTSSSIIITDGWIDRDIWLQMVDIQNFKSEYYEGHIVCVTRQPATGQYIGYAFNLASQTITSFDASSASERLGFYRDPINNRLYHVTDANGLSVFNEGTPLTGVWESGDVVLPQATSLSCGRIVSNAESGNPVKLTVTSTGNSGSGQRTITKQITTDRPFRIKPTGRKYLIRLKLEFNKRISLCMLAVSLGRLR